MKLGGVVVRSSLMNGVCDAIIGKPKFNLEPDLVVSNLSTSSFFEIQISKERFFKLQSMKGYMYYWYIISGVLDA